MSHFIVSGGRALSGSLSAQGAKNAALPILAATLLSEKPVCLHNCPRLSDVENMIALMRSLGCQVAWEGTALHVDTRGAQNSHMPEHLMKALRSSIFLLGPMVARFREATAAFPGGCDIGERPIDLHIKAMRTLGAQIEKDRDTIRCDGKNLTGAHIHLDYPSVGATENAMMAAVAAKGESVIHHAAREPEIVDLQDFLNAIGCRVWGAGSNEIHVQGGITPKAAEHRILPDRIAAGTYLCGAAITGGDVEIRGISRELLGSVLNKLLECGAQIEADDTHIRLIGPKRPREIKKIVTTPYPGFPTDMQAQMFALCTVAQGTSVIVEKVFESRFKHAPELIRMGADCSIEERTAVIRGVERLTGAKVSAWDLRGGAAMILAGLRAEGETTVRNAAHIDRGYEAIERDLSMLGAEIRRVRENDTRG